jgi:ankyrin repeat protein
MGSLRTLRRNRAEGVEIPKPSDELLILLIRVGTVDRVEALLEQGINPNAMDKYSNPALHHAIRHREVRMTQILVKYGADVNQHRSGHCTALEAAIFSGSKEAKRIMSFLLDHGADLNAVDRNGCTTLMRAIVHKRFDLAKLLVERGADPKRRNRDGKRAVDLIGRGKGSRVLRKLLKEIS